MNILGSRIEMAHDNDRARSLFLSDLHIPIDGGRSLQDLRGILDTAREDASQTRVLILGDLFDAYIGPKQLRVGACREVCDALRRATDAGVSVTVLHGNRDYMLDDIFAQRCGVRVVAGGLRFRLGEREGIALHGDELCLNDHPYQRSKRWLRHPITRFVLRHLPLAVALWAGRRARDRSDKTMNSGSQERFAPTEEAIREALSGSDLLVFGHIHVPASGSIEGAGDYRVLPAFDEGGVRLEDQAGSLAYRGSAGEMMDDFPERIWPHGGEVGSR